MPTQLVSKEGARPVSTRNIDDSQEVPVVSMTRIGTGVPGIGTGALPGTGSARGDREIKVGRAVLFRDELGRTRPAPEDFWATATPRGEPAAAQDASVFAPSRGD